VQIVHPPAQECFKRNEDPEKRRGLAFVEAKLKNVSKEMKTLKRTGAKHSRKSSPRAFQKK
jgi:hypothetical protein